MRQIVFFILLGLSSAVIAMDRFTMEYYFRDTDVRIIDDEKGTSIVLPSDRLFTKPGDPTLDLQKYPAMLEILHVVRKHDDIRIWVTAHTDDVPPQPYQYELSYLQAKQVADYLAAGGVDPNQIKRVSGEGARWPIAANDNALGRAANRRIEITFLRPRDEQEVIKPLPKEVVGIPETFVEPELEIEREERMREVHIKGK